VDAARIDGRCISSDEEYVALESGSEVYIVASKLAKDAAEKCGLADPRELAHFPGRKLERLNFQHPFLDRKVLGVLADYVTMDTGTGVVHTAPSHGAEDFATGVKYGLDATSNVDEKASSVTACPNTLASVFGTRINPSSTWSRAAALCCTRKRPSTPILTAGAAQSRDFSRYRAVVHLDGTPMPGGKGKMTPCARAPWPRSRT